MKFIEGLKYSFFIAVKYSFWRTNITANTLSAEIICDYLENIQQKEKGEKYKKKK